MNIWTDCNSAEELYLVFYERWMDLQRAEKEIRTRECRWCGSEVVDPREPLDDPKKPKLVKKLKNMSQEEQDLELLKSDIRVELQTVETVIAAAHGNERAKAWIRHLATIAHGRAYWDGLPPEEQAAIRDEAVSKIKAKPQKNTGKATDATKKKAARERGRVAGEYGKYLNAHRAAQFVMEGRITIGPEWEWADGPTIEELTEREGI